MPLGELGQVLRRRFWEHQSRVVDQDFYPLEGGLTQELPPLQAGPGELLGVKNFEPGIHGGYGRIEGIERFDGQTAPSEADYWILDYDGGDSTPPATFAVDEPVDGDTSGASGVVLAVVETTAGVDGYIVLGRVTGTFQNDEDLSVSATVRAQANGTADINSASTDALDDSYNQLAQEDARGEIAKVPGAGAVRGVWIYRGKIYAFRDNAGQTAGVMHVATTSGWSTVALGTKLYFREGEEEITEGATVSGASSSASLTARRIVVTAGTFENGDAEGYIITDSVTSGPFTDNEDLQIPAAVVADTPATLQHGIRFKADGETTPIVATDVIDGGTSSAQLTVSAVVVLKGNWADGDAEGYLMASGAITGTFQNSEDLEISATKVAATPGKATQAVAFENGAVEIKPNMAISGVTSSASMTVQRVDLITGTWAGGDAVGYIATDTVTGGPFQASEDLQRDLVVLAAKTITDTAQVAQTLPAGGLYRFHNHNFGGHTKTYRMYGVNGVGKAFEFDNQVTPNVFVLIDTGMEDDTPAHIEEFNNHLFLSFTGGSIQHSGFQAPLIFNPILGADERTTGDNVTNMYADRNKALIILTRQNTWVLYGSSRENFELRKHTEETGGIENTLQRIGDAFYIDDRGVTQLGATEAFGNFQANSLSTRIEKLIKNLLTNNAVRCSLISRRKNLIRWVLDSGQTLVLGVRSGQPVGFTLIDYGKTFHCACSEEFDTGSLYKERIFMGGDDGYVYEADKGTTIDGDFIEGFLRVAYHHSGKPDRIKHYRKATFDVDTDGDATFDATVDYNYGRKTGQASTELALEGGIGYWDVDNWDEFDLGGSAFQRPSIKLFGSGYNIGFFIYTKQKYEPRWTINGVSLQLAARRINRDTGE